MNHDRPPADGELTSFVGRRRELAEVQQALDGARVVTLTGPGGVGKSRLARRALQDRAAASGVPVWCADLAEVADPAVLAAAVGEAMGLRPVALEEQADHIATFLGDGPGLLLLDGCEAAVAATGELVAAVLRRCPGLRVLATSRQPLGLSGEQVLPVPPMALPPSGALAAGGGGPDLAAVAAADAVALFVERARAASPEFTLAADDAATVTRLVTALDGLPLAIELAAARIRTLPPAAMLQRVGRLAELGGARPAGRPERQRSLEASVAWSERLCTAEERTLWARLSVFSGRFDLDAAEEVCSGDGLARGDVLALLSSLVDKSVVARDPTVPVAHYRMLHAVVSHGAAMLARTDDPDRWRVRHREYLLALTERYHREWVGPRQAEWMELLQRNHANLQTVLQDASREPSLATVALRIGVALELFWFFRGRVGELRHWLDAALSHPLLPGPEVVAGLALCAFVAGIQRDDATADRRLAEARGMLAACPSLRDDVTLARVAFAAGVVALFRAEHAAAVASFEEAVARSRRAGYLYVEPAALGLLGDALDSVGRHDEADARWRECLTLTDRHGEQASASWVLWRTARRARDTGHREEALDRAQRALALKQRLGDRLGTAMVLEVLADLAADAGDTVRSGTLRGAAGRVWQTLGPSATTSPYLARHRELARRPAGTSRRARALREAYERGLALPLEEAVALALRPPEQPAASPLSARERQVAALLGEGMSDQEIARALVISVRTAQGHVESIRRKLGFRSRTQVAAWVAREGS